MTDLEKENLELKKHIKVLVEALQNIRSDSDIDWALAEHIDKALASLPEELRGIMNAGNSAPATGDKKP